MLHEDLKRLFSAFPKDAHPMAVCAAVVAALSTFYPEDLDPLSRTQVLASGERLIAKFPTIAAYSYKHSRRQPFRYPDNRLNDGEKFVRRTFATPCEAYRRLAPVPWPMFRRPDEKLAESFPLVWRRREVVKPAGIFRRMPAASTY